MTFRPTNLRTRLTLWYVGVLALLLVVYATVVLAFQYGVLTRQIYHDEVQDVVTVEGLLFFDQAGDLQLTQNYYSRPQSHLLVDRLMEIRDLSGKVLYRTSTLRGMALGGPLRKGEGDTGFDQRLVRLEDGSHAFIVSHIHTMQGRTVVIRLGYDLGPLRARMYQFFLLLFISIPLALVLAALAGQTIARRALQPLEQMTSRAQRITASNLGERLDIANERDELGNMARVFNHLLERLEQAFRQLQSFTADASHELRTPLAAIRTISEVALEKPTDAEAYREALGSVLEESARLNQTVDSLLLLARAESTPPGQSQPVFFVGDLVREVIALLEVLGEERGVRIIQKQVELANVEVHADRGLMRIALMNIVHNALKFSPKDSAIIVDFAQPSASWLQIGIQDEGPGIPPGEYAKVFERFFTSSDHATADISGVGLGLAISKLVVERAGGRIGFDEDFQQGARCLIDLPCTSADQG
ncbi:heavy metal sensor kinase [Granulicella pectinivorans]|uniref:histidine kinase n=1 Tax=Granulicella pectinivorans TaxID=474950 RepID=A0A1I6MD56_9BACT|nr:heavy metal sensor kinase [Granulicella pectinivorans]